MNPTLIDDKCARLKVVWTVHANGAAMSMSGLVVNAWQHFPDTFGLAMWKDEHPDSNRVIVEVVRAVRWGELERLPGPGVRLTQKGLLTVRHLTKKESE